MPRPTSRYAPRCWPTWLLVGLGWLACRLPTPVLTRHGRTLGHAAYVASGPLGGSRRHIAETNVALCFPELDAPARARLVRDVFAHAGVSLVETALVWLNPGRNLGARTRVEGLEHLTSAASLNRGVLLVGGHFSAMDAVAPRLASLVDLDVTYRANRNPVWEWLQVRGRRRYFGAVIERRQMREAVRRLAAGRILWYAPDQDYGPRRSVFAPFFGVPAATITTTGRLARINDSPVVFVSHCRDLARGTWTVRFEPLPGYPTRDKLADATRINEVLEATVRRRPAQYLWLHRRFKTRPPGAAPVYRSS